MKDTPTLTDTQTLLKARSILQEHLSLEATGYQCQSQHLYDVLLATCASGETLEAVCRDLVEAPEADTVRSYFNEQLTLEALPQLEQQLNRALSAEIPPRLLRKAQRIAIDFHDRPYYGPRRRRPSGYAVEPKMAPHAFSVLPRPTSSTGGCA